MRLFNFGEYNEIKLILETANLYNEDHQQAVFKIAKSLEDHFELHPGLGYKMVFQTNLDRDDAQSKRVDIAIREIKTGITRAVIDVCATSMLKEAYDRVTAMRLADSSIEEIFVYDYLEDKWFTNNTTESSYCSLIGIELSSLM